MAYRNRTDHRQPACRKFSRIIKNHSGLILLPVMLAIALVAVTAFLINREGAGTASNLESEAQSNQAMLAAKAGMSHMIWRTTNANCTGYANLAGTALGNSSYSATITPASGSPVSISVTGTDAQGSSYTLNRDRVSMYPAYSTKTLQLGTDSGMDAMIASAYTTTNFGGDENGVWKAWLFNWYYRNQLIQFNLNGVIPNTAHIVSAQLQLYQKTGGAGIKIVAHKLNRDWAEGTKFGLGTTADGATWNTYDGTNAWASAGGDYSPVPVTTALTNGSDKLTKWELGPLVQDWVSGKVPNNGVLLRTDESSTTAFSSKEDASATKRPKLVIIYTCECGTVCGLQKKIYWTDDITNKIQMADEDGSHVEDLITALDRPTGLDIDPVNQRLYWTNNKEIWRANLDGTNPQMIYSGTQPTLDIKLDVAAGKMYWTHDAVNLVMRANMDGTGSQPINTTLNKPAYLSLDTTSGYIYLTNSGDGTISRMKLDGTGVTTLVSSQGNPYGNAFDSVNGKIYWSGGAANSWLRRANLNGSNLETLVTGLTEPQDITYVADSNRLYWAVAAGKQIQRANPDGTSKTTIVASGLSHPRAVALADANLIGKKRTLTLNPAADVDIYEGTPTTNYGVDINIVAGKDNIGSGKNDRILIKFDIPNMPVGATITSATLRLYLAGTSLGTKTYNIGLYKIKSPWSEATATWSNFSASGNFDTVQQAVASVALGSSGFKQWNLPLTVLNGWIATPSSNYGMALVYEGSDKGPDFQFASKEYATVSSRPQLVINYTLP